MPVNIKENDENIISPTNKRIVNPLNHLCVEPDIFVINIAIFTLLQCNLLTGKNNSKVLLYALIDIAPLPFQLSFLLQNIFVCRILSNYLTIRLTFPKKTPQKGRIVLLIGGFIPII